MHWRIRYDEIERGENLGAGSYGIVYCGRWKTGGFIDLALKEPNPRGFVDVDEFMAEGQMMTQLRHPNLVQLYAICPEPKHYSLVMEYMQRGYLYALLHQPRGAHLNIPQIYKIAMDTARGMCYLHNHEPPILHRDLTSSNLLLDKDGGVKITDFGLTRQRLPEGESLIGGRVGAFRYMARELFAPRAHATVKSDVYSYGVTLWELITSKTPWEDLKSEREIEDAVCGNLPRRLPIPAETPPTLARLMSACWRERAEERPTMNDILRELEQLPAAAAAPHL